MYGWMIMYMTSQTSSLPEPSRLRRRVIVELTVNELPLLEAAERRHGTKRAAVLAGLRAEAEVAALRAQVAEPQRAVAAEQTRGAEAKATAHRRRQGEQREPALVEVTREREAAQAELVSLDDRLARAEDTIARDRTAHSDEVRGLMARIPEALYCARCDGWVPEEQWSWAIGADFDHVYHAACGDHGPGVLASASWLARWKHWVKSNR